MSNSTLFQTVEPRAAKKDPLTAASIKQLIEPEF